MRQMCVSRAQAGWNLEGWGDEISANNPMRCYPGPSNSANQMQINQTRRFGVSDFPALSVGWWHAYLCMFMLQNPSWLFVAGFKPIWVKSNTVFFSSVSVSARLGNFHSYSAGAYFRMWNIFSEMLWVFCFPHFWRCQGGHCGFQSYVVQKIRQK